MSKSAADLLQLAATDMQSTMASAPGAPIGRPTSAPPPAEGAAQSHIGNLRPSPLLTSLSATNSAVSSPALLASGSLSKSKGMQLGANRVPSAILAENWIDESSDVNPWGNEDLIDVNADQDDWSK